MRESTLTIFILLRKKRRYREKVSNLPEDIQAVRAELDLNLWCSSVFQSLCIYCQNVEFVF